MFPSTARHPVEFWKNCSAMFPHDQLLTIIRAAHMFPGILNKITQDAQLPKANQALVHLTFFNKHCGILEELRDL